MYFCRLQFAAHAVPLVPVAVPFVSIVDAQLYGHDTKQIEAGA